MRNTFLIVAIAFSTVAFAQKRELKKIEKALEDNNYEQSSSIFNEIDENSVEEKYAADYTFYKGVTMLGNPENPKASKDQLPVIIDLFQKSETLGYEDKEKVNFYLTAAKKAVLQAAQQSLEAGNTEEALSSINYLLELNPENQLLRENSAALSYQLEDYEAAKKNYEILNDEEYTGQDISIIATNAKTMEDGLFPSMKAAEIAVKSGQYVNAREERTESSIGNRTRNLAWIYKNDGDLDKAKELIESMKSKYPDDKNLNAAVPDLFLLVGDNDNYEKAITAMEEEVTDPRVYEQLGIAAGDKEDWEQAIFYYKKSINLNPDNYVTQNNIAVAYINQGNAAETSVKDQKLLFIEATDHLEKVIELKPELKSAKETAISIYEFLDMKEKAASLKSKM